MWQYNGRTLRNGRSWTDDSNVTHPYTWGLWSEATKLAYGLVWVEPPPPPEPYDERFYYSAGNSKPLDDVNVVDVDGNVVLDTDGNQMIQQGLKTVHIAKTKATCNSKLTPTDWMIIRNQENNKAVPQEILDYRASVRAACDSIETAINGTTTLEEFMALFDAKYDESNGNRVLVEEAPINKWPKEV